MSKTSFKVYCIENYSNHERIPSTEVFRLFESSGILEQLDTDYEDLHEMGKEWLMNYFDEWMYNQELESKNMFSSHHLVKIAILPMVIELLAKEHEISEDQALKVLYTSHIGSALDDDSLGLYGQGPIYLQSLIDEEIASNPSLIPK